jgi:glycine cleavage system H protein
MGQLLFSRDHEWVRLEGGVATVGITHHAAEALGDLVFVELPDLGRPVMGGETVAVVESVKAASDVYAPLPGTVIEVNQALVDDPSLGNRDPGGEGWLYKLAVTTDVDLSGLLDIHEYQALLGE